MAINLNDTSGDIQAAMGYWHFQNFNWKEAEKFYRKAIELSPNQTNVYLWLAILLEGKDEKDEAMEVYEKGSEINPEWDYLIRNRIRALANARDQQESIRLLTHLIEKAAYEPVLQKKRYADLARLHWSFRNIDEAITAATKAQDNALLLFFRKGDNSLLVREVNEHYNVISKSGEYVSELWKGIQYAKAGAKDQALINFNNAVVLKETSVSLLLIGHYEFLNLKYINFVYLKRKVKGLINF